MFECACLCLGVCLCLCVCMCGGCLFDRLPYSKNHDFRGRLIHRCCLIGSTICCKNLLPNMR